MLALLLALAWPFPCADAGTCWLAWDQPGGGRVEWYEVISGDRLCARLDGHTDRRGRWHAPRAVYWPRPGDGCAPGAREYRIIACNSAGCGGSKAAETFGPQTFRCFTPDGETGCDQ